jgi:hypothetical protein
MDFKNSLDCVVAFHFPCLSGNTCHSTKNNIKTAAEEDANKQIR